MPILGMPFSGRLHPIGAKHVANLYLFMLSKLKLTKMSFKNKSVAKQLMSLDQMDLSMVRISPVDQPQIRDAWSPCGFFSNPDEFNTNKSSKLDSAELDIREPFNSHVYLGFKSCIILTCHTSDLLS